MKVPQTLLLLVGALCACSSVSGQASSHVREAFRYQPQQPLIPSFSEQYVFDHPVKADDLLADKPAKILGVKVRIVPENDEAFTPSAGQKDLLPAGLMKQYRNGFSVGLPFTSEPTTVYIRGGLAWEIGKHTHIVFPSFSRTTGFRFIKSF